ncbi:hypothetical protein KOI35_02940 [Actinoplanes bogorensis]|uniref:Uncharacterized protein n=1 Tax=Paractinoplanes bogorensis TaxID=1610840 RepID=A0ABS5YG55_9ACTN|nr:hypothetical protein [Actinoplanes bogorensis]MBU2662458.1 hypothetical protein [Actinoplanes bogorensis]
MTDSRDDQPYKLPDGTTDPDADDTAGDYEYDEAHGGGDEPGVPGNLPDAPY